MSDSLTPNIRPATPADAYLAALLINSTQEPHFTHTAQKLAETFAGPEHGYVISETEDTVTGLASLWLPDFQPSHGWVGLHLHPDFLSHAPALLAELSRQTRQAGRTHLWASVREDYLPRWPDLPAHGFREVHRTFGGGIFLKDWAFDTGPLTAQAAQAGYTLTPAAPHQHDPRLSELYARIRADQVAAPPTITPAGEQMTDDDALWNAGWLAWHGETLVGLALPEKSRLDAWNALLVVDPQHRRRGLGTLLLAQVAHTLRGQGMGFLNVAGSKKDAAYLGTLRRVGANIEPDWIAWESTVENIKLKFRE